MTRQLLIFGAGGFAREVLQVALDLAVAHRSDDGVAWQPIGFVVDAAYASDTPVHGLPVLATDVALARYPDAWFVVGVGSPALRRRAVHALKARVGKRWATLIHPSTWIGRRVQVGLGTVICAGCQITTDIEIGEHVHVNLGCTIGHDSRLDSFVTLNPGVNVSGNVILSEGVEVGTGSILIPHADAGAWSVIGAGSVVTRSLSTNVTAVGAPAKVIKSRPMGWHEAGTA
jgi:sugar O-acyltransferase (sialic acid O-acetyltransferase NeuD family)